MDLLGGPVDSQPSISSQPSTPQVCLLTLPRGLVLAGSCLGAGRMGDGNEGRGKQREGAGADGRLTCGARADEVNDEKGQVGGTLARVGAHGVARSLPCLEHSEHKKVREQKALSVARWLSRSQ